MEKRKKRHWIEPLFKTEETARINRAILVGKGWECGQISPLQRKGKVVGFSFQATKEFVIGQNYVKSIPNLYSDFKAPKEKPWDKQAEEYAKTHTETEGEDDGVRGQDEGGGGEEHGGSAQIGL